ncbi:hypothetical protein LTR04_004580 [Oleoguttula sp. CCFEE 6159]|nr:hypothetical protein LTR04_004580 [Oleoguttula sp. CCFEE 6159]
MPPPPPPLQQTIYVGPFVFSKAPTELDICPYGAIGVTTTGTISFIDRDVPAELNNADGTRWKAEKGTEWEDARMLVAEEAEFFFPGFVDTHIHASQYPNAGIFGKSTLMDWLDTYTFPLEASFADLATARRVYARVVARTLAHGTTTAAYHATIHVAATNLLADICVERGQRALVGRVCMDTLSPEYYRDESVEAAVRDSRACIAHVRQLDPRGELVTPVITPRFAPSCTTPCLRALGELHRETGAWCQTHMSENVGEIAMVRELFPDSADYASVYDEAGLLTPKTILAHAVHLSEAERKLVERRKAKVSHCPASNTALTSGCARVRELWDAGITVGLGTDVSGGYSASVLEAARQAIMVSRHVAMTEGDGAKLSTEEVLYLATRGGAKVVGLEDKIGAFEVGMQWDAQLVGLGEVAKGEEGKIGESGPVDVFGWEQWEERVAKWLYNGDDRNTKTVWVKGRLVHYRPEMERRN